MPKTDLENALNHRYVTSPGRKPAVGASTIAGCLDTGKSNGMAWAASGIAVDYLKRCYAREYIRSRDWEDARREFRRLWDKTSDLGSRVHENAMDWWEGKTVQETAATKPYLDALAAAIEVEGIQPLLFERLVVFPEPRYLEFGGRFDVIARVSDGRTALVDLKTGKRRLDSVTLQLNAYAHCQLAEYDMQTGALTGTSPLPAIDFLAVLYLHDDGMYEFLQVPFESEVWDAFCGLRTAYGWRKGRMAAWEKTHPAPQSEE